MIFSASVELQALRRYNKQGNTEKVWEMSMKYKVNMQKTDEGYAVWVHGLPGCWSQGKTEAEVLANIKDAIQAYLETLKS